MQKQAAFELWDRRTSNLVLEFERLDEALVALRDYVRRNGEAAVEGLSLVAVSDDAEISMTLASDERLLSLISAMAGSAR